MTASQLITYLSELSAQQLRIEFARELLAKNMNFSPAWILAILHQNNLHSTCEFTISHLNTLLQMIGMDLSSNDILLLFDCFDPKKSGQVSTKSFIDFLLPLNNEVLRNVVAKRIASDLQFSMDLKYALKRLFSEMLSTKVSMRGYEKIFLPKPLDDYGEIIDKQQIKQFFKIHGKYPNETQLNFIDKMIKGNRIQGISVKQIKQTIQKCQRDFQQRCKQIKNNQMLLPTSLVSLITSQQLSPMKKINPFLINSPIQNFTPIKNTQQKNKYIKQQSNYKTHHNYQQMQIKNKNNHQTSKIFSKCQKKQNQFQKIHFINSPYNISKTTSVMQTIDQNQNKNKNQIITDHSLSNNNYSIENKKYLTKQQKQRSLSRTPKQRINNTNYVTPQAKKSEIRSTYQNKTSESGRYLKNSIKQTDQTVIEREYLKLIQSNNQLEDQLSMIKWKNQQRMIRIQEDLQKFK